MELFLCFLNAYDLPAIFVVIDFELELTLFLVLVRACIFLACGGLFL